MGFFKDIFHKRVKHKAPSGNQFNEDCIAAHNKLRAMHGCAPLKYDENLAKQAQKHAEHLVRLGRMQHSQKLDCGENIASKCGTAGVDLTGYEASVMWYSEIKDYDFNGGDQLHCGHFTQVVWSDTNSAGFGIAKSPKGDKVFVVGQYKPAGNFMGQYKAKVPCPKNGRVYVPSAEELCK